MEEDRIKEIFADFKPEISSDISFLARLQSNLDSVEMVRARNEAINKRTKLAVVIAACVGFIAGFLFSIALPYISTMLGNLINAFPQGVYTHALLDNTLTLTWILIGAATIFISLNTYNASLHLLTRRAPTTPLP